MKARFPHFYLFMTIALVIGQLLPMHTLAHSGGDTVRSVHSSPVGAASNQGFGVSDAAYPEPIDPNSTAPILTLSEGNQQGGAVEQLPVAPSEPLSDAEVQAILDRLPPLEVDEDDSQDFRLPSESPPPPRTGETVEASFPPAEDEELTAEVVDGPLEVLRFAPEGEIGIAPFLNVTFNQPMVPLGTLQDLALEDVPVTITPELPGKWKWLGTRTLSFEYGTRVAKDGSEEVPEDEIAVDRFPKATEYTVEIPAGTESANGNVLEEAVTWTFTTPAPVVEQFYPYSRQPQPRDPIFFVSFEQLIDAEAVLETIRVSASGEEFPTALVTADEIAEAAEAEDASSRAKQLHQLVQNGKEGRWLAFRTLEKLPANTTVTVYVGPGTPSAEGPLTTEQPQSFSFQTYAPLRITESECGYGTCTPAAPFNITFNNPLAQSVIEADLLADGLVTIEPEIPNVSVDIYSNRLTIQGLTQGRTTYNVTISADLLDAFGQTLGEDETITFEVGPANPVLFGPDQGYITIDPSSSEPAVNIYSTNHDQVRARLYAVEPADWEAYSEFRQQFHSNNPIDPPGELVSETVVDIESEPDQLAETAIPLSDGLDGNYGHLIVIVDLQTGDVSDAATGAAALVNRLLPGRSNYVTQPIHTWVQVTQIGLDAVADSTQLVAWSTDLNDGTPLADVELQLGVDGPEQPSNKDGIATFELTDTPATMLIARNGEDSAFLPQSPYGYGGGWRTQTTYDQLSWYVIDDRQMYRPGEEVHVKGWIRQLGGGPRGDIGLYEQAQTVRYTLMGPQGNEIATDEVEVNSAGGFDLALTLPDNMNLGYANLQLNVTGSSVGNLNSRDYWHSFQVQEFRRPEFEVTAGNETTGPYFVGDEAVVFVEAAYFAGGPLPNAETYWDVEATPTTYSPPNWRDFTFGKWTPWWFFNSYYGDPFGSGGEAAYQNFNSATDASGKHYLNVQFESNPQSDADPQPYSIRAGATVMDVNRQAWSANTTLMIHPAELYVGLRSERVFVEAGEPLEIEAIVTDVDGNAVGGQEIEIVAARLEWKRTKGEWNEELVDPQTCVITSTAFPETEPTTCTFETEFGGRYQITATVTDGEGRTNLTQITRWVSGGDRPTTNRVEQEQVTLIPDKENYQPGDVAEILVQSPFGSAEGHLIVGRDGILYEETFSMTGGSTVIRVPIEDAYVPGISVQIDLNGATERIGSDGQPDDKLPSRPAFATGQIDLAIPPDTRTLDVSIEPAATALGPGESTSVDVTVLDANEEPVENAELAVIVVDEAVLALSNYQLTDPLAVFYYTRGLGVYSRYSRSSIVLTDPQALAAQAMEQSMTTAADGGMNANLRSRGFVGGAAPSAAPMAMEESMAMDDAADMDMAYAESAEEGAAEKSADQNEAIEVRTNFDPLALFAPDVKTDADGKATVDIDLPDNLTRYRIMVVAASGDNHFGSSESNLTARLPLMVRPSAPRFLRFGDAFELPVVLQNQTDEAMDVEVAVQATNINLAIGAADGTALLPDPAYDGSPTQSGQMVTVPANDRVEVRFPATTVSAGAANFQIAAVSGDIADAATVADVPVYTPATTEAFATYGIIDGGANEEVAINQPILPPSDVFTQFGGLEIETSSTALQALTDALIYLTTYPYECSEQLASRIMAIATLRDVLDAFDAEQLPAASEMEAAVARDIETLQGLQNNDGGYPIWQRGRESIPYYSIFVTHALYKADEKGYSVPAEMQQRALDYLRNIENHYPSWYSQKTRDALSSYAIYVRSLLGDVDTAKAIALYERAGTEDLTLEALAWLLHLLGADEATATQADEIRRHFENRVVETAGAANFTTSYGDDDYVMLHSNRRTDGVILDALMADQPESDLIPKVVTGLLAHRNRGRWRNTQENAFILLALDTYFNTYESQTPNFVASVWLGDDYVGSQEFQGRSTDRHNIDVPMEFVVENGPAGETQDLILSKDGAGRLYYRLGMRYAPTDLDMPPVDMGFVVQRTYEAIDDPEDVTQNEDGIWHFKAGARVRVCLTMVADSRRYNVALVDPLPAGLEIVNPALAVSDVPTDPTLAESRSSWWWGTWYEHQNLRDDRAEAFTSLLWDGVHEYSYVARATTPGEFVASPAKAEEMYSPEVFGRSSSERVVVE